MIYILQQPNDDIMSFLKKQDNNICKKYIESPYLIKIYHHGYKIIYNLLTNEKISCSIPLEEKDLTFLIEKWYLLDKDINPYFLYKSIQDNLYLGYKNQNNYNLLNNFEHMIIFTTLGCNANCYYCYENNLRNNKYKMSKQVADKIITLLLKNNKKKISIGWFGGEPLYNEQIIDYISNQLKSNNIEYESNMFSNGLLFNDENIIKAKEIWNLKKIQITIDGTEPFYEKIKNVPSGSFNILLANIKKLLQQKIKIVIRLNVSEQNYKDLKKLVYILYDNFKQYSNLSIGVHELFGEEKKKNTYNNLLYINSAIEATFGKTTDTPLSWKNSGCMADRGNAITILPDGKISICEHCIDHNIVTDLENNFYNIDIINKFSNYSDREECQSCEFRPGCIFSEQCPANGGQSCNINRKKYLSIIAKKHLYDLAEIKRKRRQKLMITKNLYTNLDIYNKAAAMVEAFNAKDGSELNYPVKVNFYLQKNMNAFLNLAKEIEQKRIEIIQKYGNPSEENPDEYKIPDDKIEEASKEIQDFLELEQEVPVSMLKLDWFDNIDMNAAQVAAISFMIEEEE